MNAPTFRASTTILTGQMLLAVVPVSTAICFLFFGGLGWRLAAASLAALAPLIWGLAWLITRLDQVEFDEASAIIRRRWRKPLPWDDIESLRFLRSAGSVQVSAQTHAGRSEVILLGLPGRDEQRLKETFTQLRSDIPLVARSYKAWKLTAVALVLMLAIYTAGMYWIWRESPVTRVACIDAEFGPAPPGSLVRQGAGIRVQMPATFEGARFRVMNTGRFTEVGGIGQWFLRVAGIDSEYELFHYAACARQGLVPMFLKTALLGQWDDPQVVESIGSPNRRLAILGRRGGAGEASILVLNTEHDVEALIALRLGDQVTREQLRRQLGSISVEPAPAR